MAKRLVPGVAILIIVAAGFFAYRNSLNSAFIFDDRTAIEKNARIRTLWPLWNALSPPWRTAVAGRPVANLTLALNYAMGGLRVWGYHVFNVGTHLLAALALYAVVRRTLLGPTLRERHGQEAPWIALAVAVIWVVHPLLTESVIYTTQRTELLMGLFFLLTLYCVIRGAESSRPVAWYACAVVSNLLGMGSKEVAVVVPLVVLAYDRLFLAESFWDIFRRRWGLYTGLAASWLFLAVALRLRPLPPVPYSGAGVEVARWDYALTQSGVIVHYLRLAMWPRPLVGDYYDWPTATSLASVLPTVLVILALLGATAWALYRRSWLGFLGAWFFLILAPTSSIYPMLEETAAERRMYLSLAAVIALVVVGGHAVVVEVWRRLGWPRERRALLEAALVVVIVATFAQMTDERTKVYRSAGAFWRDIVTKRPENARARHGLGQLLAARGRHEEALQHYAEALRIRPADATLHYSIGKVLADQGKLDEAVARYRETLRIGPGFGMAHNNLGAALTRQGKLDEAIVHFREAIRIEPQDVIPRHNLAEALARLGRFDEAVVHYREALLIAPDAGVIAVIHNNLAKALAAQGKVDEAIGHYRDALRIAPGYATAHSNLGTALATQGKLAEAVAHYEQAVRINPDDTQARSNLAAAQARQKTPR